MASLLTFPEFLLKASRCGISDLSAFLQAEAASLAQVAAARYRSRQGAVYVIDYTRNRYVYVDEHFRRLREAPRGLVEDGIADIQVKSRDLYPILT